MTRRMAVLVIAVLLIALAAGLYFVPQLQRRANARRVVSAYNVALSRALFAANTAPMKEFAGDREMGRLQNYFVELRGRGVIMEAELLSIDFEEVRSEDPTVTVLTRERWRYSERSQESGQRLSQPLEEEQRLEYTLLERDGGLVVHLSRLREDESANGED